MFSPAESQVDTSKNPLGWAAAELGERVRELEAVLKQAVPRSDGAKGGRPAFDHVLMFKVLLLQAMHALSDERVEYLIKDRLSFMRFLGLGLADPVPDANTIWTFREALTRAQIGGRENRPWRARQHHGRQPEALRNHRGAEGSSLVPSASGQGSAGAVRMMWM